MFRVSMGLPYTPNRYSGRKCFRMLDIECGGEEELQFLPNVSAL
ncbi:hypothetical protein TSMEX_008723 [Taenia solium]|eukprot:TsM_000368600 transcript=TsM_000368600 gene=TsM_000368600